MSTAKPRSAVENRAAVDALRLAVGDMFGAERRLRSRDHRRPGELTHSQMRALAALGREQEMTAGELARSADLNPATITAILDQLEDAGMVTRRRSSDDRRVCYVSLTPGGWEVLQHKLATWLASWHECCADLSDESLELATAVIERVSGMYDAIHRRLEAGADAGDVPAS